MLPLLRHIESISACRDRDILAASVIAGIHESFPTRRVMLLRLPYADADAGELIACADADGLRLVGEGDAEQPIVAMPDETSECLRLPLDTAGSGSGSFLIVELTAPLDQERRETLERFARFYINYLRLLDDSEQDTLTQLFNRKTFDESFDRLLADDRSEPPPDDQPERREPAPETKRQWLAVADIDHFKRVNDNFGHLFGDEVLIRFAGLMKKSFRKTDRLFRFGGEEFVILLKPSTEANIARLLDRFRAAVEAYEFPRVGQVTCSLGFAPIDPLQAPSDILGAADTALYFSKEHGRNQVNCYSDLIARGLVKPAKAIEADQPDDIDALFG